MLHVGRDCTPTIEKLWVKPGKQNIMCTLRGGTTLTELEKVEKFSDV